jgi:hypothetical protein
MKDGFTKFSPSWFILKKQQMEVIENLEKGGV